MQINIGERMDMEVPQDDVKPNFSLLSRIRHIEVLY
jgi:hypothetical protein